MDKIVAQIDVLTSKGYDLKDMAILCRTTKESREAAILGIRRLRTSES